MNKKTLFLILLAVILTCPTIISAITLPEMVKNIGSMTYQIGTALIIIGWIIAGILWLTSAGNPEKTGIAKKALIAAVIGTVLIILASAAVGIQQLVKDALGV